MTVTTNVRTRAMGMFTSSCPHRCVLHLITSGWECCSLYLVRTSGLFTPSQAEGVGSNQNVEEADDDHDDKRQHERHGEPGGVGVGRRRDPEHFLQQDQQRFGERAGNEYGVKRQLLGLK